MGAVTLDAAAIASAGTGRPRLGARVEGAGGVGVVVADVGDPAPVAPAGPKGRLLAQQVGVHIGLHGQPLGGTAGQGVGHPPGQVESGPVGEGDHVDLADADAGQAQAEPDGLVGEALGVPLAVEPLLLGQRDQPPVLQQAGRRVVAEAVDPKDAHPAAPSTGRTPVRPDADR
jgi:hypothetical protein